MDGKELIELSEVMSILESLGTMQTRKTYMNHGAKEPLYGVTTGDLKPLAKRIKRNHELAMALYHTGNYDAMYFAGMISEPEKMTKEDMELWIKGAYCQGISDYVVALALAGTDFACEVADSWIDSGKDLYASSGWSCYSCLLSYKADEFFDLSKISGMLERVRKNIHTSPDRVRYSMNGFVIAVGISFIPLHVQALETAQAVGTVSVDMGNTNCRTPVAFEAIQKAVSLGRLGYKRKNIRC